MHGASRFVSREKQVFLVGFSFTLPRFPRKSKNRLNTSLRSESHSIAIMLLRRAVTTWEISEFGNVFKFGYPPLPNLETFLNSCTIEFPNSATLSSKLSPGRITGDRHRQCCIFTSSNIILHF